MHRHAIPDIEYRTKLAERGLECHLLLSDGDRRAFETELSGVLGNLLENSYGRSLTPECLSYESWAVVIAPSPAAFPHNEARIVEWVASEFENSPEGALRFLNNCMFVLKNMIPISDPCELTEKAFMLYQYRNGVKDPTERETSLKNAPVACATLSFTAEYPSYFATRFEAVHPSLQGTGLGRILFDCIASWCRFLVFNDELAQQGVLASDGNYCLVSYIDAPSQDGEWVGPRDNPSGHGAFLQKIGFTHAQHDFGQKEDELAFQRAFRINIPRQDACEDEERASVL